LLSVLPVATIVGVVVGDGKAQVVLLRFSEFAIERVSRSGVPRLQRGSEVVPSLLHYAKNQGF